MIQTLIVDWHHNIRHLRQQAWCCLPIGYSQFHGVSAAIAVAVVLPVLGELVASRLGEADLNVKLDRLAMSTGPSEGIMELFRELPFSPQLRCQHRF